MSCILAQASITNLADVLKLSPAESSKGLFVQAQGQVLHADPAWELLHLAVRGASNAVFATCHDSNLKDRRLPQPGDIIDFEGITAKGARQPDLRIREFTIIDRQPLPAPRVLGADAPLSELLDSQWVRIQGTVVSVLPEEGRLHPEFAIQSGKSLRLVVANLDRESAMNLRGTTLEVTGMFGVNIEPGNQASRRHDIWVSTTNDLRVLSRLSPSPIADLLPRLPAADNLPVWLEGSIENPHIGEHFTLRDATGSIRVLFDEVTPISPSAEFEVLGFAGWSTDRPVLRRAWIRPKPSPTARAIPDLALTIPLAADPQLPEIPRIQQVRDLSAVQASKGYPVRVTGVVTYHTPGHDTFLQDKSAGIYLQARRISTPLSVGQRVQVKGFSGPGDFAPIVYVETANVLGDGRLPTPKPVTLRTLMTGTEDSQWVTLEGVIRQHSVTDGHHVMLVATSDGLLEVYVPEIPDHDPPFDLVDAGVEFEGVAATRFNEHRELEGVKLMVPAWDFVHPRNIGSPDPFSLTARPIRELFQFRSGTDALHRLHVEGTVTAVNEDQSFYLQDGTGGILVQPSGVPPALGPGSRVRLVGFPAFADKLPVMQNSRVEVLPEVQLPVARVLDPDHLLEPALHATLVQLDGRVLSHARRPSQDTVTLQCGSAIVDVVLEHKSPESTLRTLAANTEIRCFGIYLAQYDDERQMRAFRVLLRSPADLVVLSRPPWWNLRHTLSVVGTLAAVLAAGGFWIFLLRRQVSAQTRDLRQRLEIEAELERRFRELFETANDFIYTRDLNDNYTSINPAGLRLLQYSQSEAAHLNAAQVVAPEFRSSMGRLMQEKLAREGTTTSEIEYVAKDGQRVQLEECCRLVYRNGVAVGVQGIARDISERKRNERLIQQQRRFIRSIVDTDPNLILVHDPDGRIVLVNQAGLDFYGWESENVVGRREIELRPQRSEEIERRHRDHQEILDRLRERFIPEETVTDRHGNLRWLQTAKRPLISPDGTTRLVLSVSIDITDRKRSEEELRKAKATAESANRAKSEFVANMSHEIRTPMNGVIGMTNLLLDTPLSPEQRGFAEIVRQSAEGLLGIINDILDFSKIEAGKLRFEPVNFDLREALASCVDLLEEKAARKHLRLSSHLPDDLVTALFGDAGRIRQVLLNLLANAIKFTDNGNVHIEVSAESETPAEVMVRFEVLDTGIGVDPNVQSLLFRPFTQADGTTTRKYGGTGLGLAICKQLVELMQGQIGMRNRPTGGAAFWFTARLAKQITEAKPPPPNVPAAAQANPKPSLPRSLRILVAEDNIVNQQVALRLLQKMGHRVDAVANGEEAVEAASRVGYDVIFMDCQMPEMDGYEATRQLRLRGSDIRIIALTANAMQGDREKCLAAGMDEYLSKPVRAHDLERVLRECPPRESSYDLTQHSARIAARVA
ncbi:MAG: PAS domain S-box protein [Verrucomicrobiales bacterium]|nr:PAS domain S-box protein [Verrucomicrobiales bacterium]